MAKPAAKKPATKAKTQGASRNRKSGARKSVPAFVWAVLGVAVGLFAAFLWHLSELNKINAARTPDNTSTENAAIAASNPSEKPVASAPEKPAKKTSTEANPAEKTPHFDFYTLLPNQKVSSRNSTNASSTSPAATPAPIAPGDIGRVKPLAHTADKPVKNNEPLFLLQAGSFKNEAEADKRRAAVLLIGLPVNIQKAPNAGGGMWYRVIVGPIKGKDAAQQARNALRGSGIESVVSKKH